MNVKDENLLTQFKTLQLRKKQAEADVDSINRQIGIVKGKLMDKFEKEGQTSSKLSTGETIYIHSQYWAKLKEGVTKENVLDTLRSIGLGHIISETYNSNTLSAHIRELKKEKQDIPEELVNVLEIEPTFDVRIRGLK